MIRKKKTFVVSLLICAIICTSIPYAIVAGEVTGEIPLGGMSSKLNELYEQTDTETEPAVAGTSLLSVPVTVPENIVICNCKQSVNIRSGPGLHYSVIGKLPKNAAGVMISNQSDGWVYIKSGEVRGYVSSAYLFLGQEGYEKAKSLYHLTATVKANHLNVRREPSTLSEMNVITEVSKNEKLIVAEEPVIETVTKNDPLSFLWVKVEIDDHEGWVSKQYVDLSYQFKTAVRLTTVASSAIRMRIVNEAKKYLGLPYVWGGTSLSSGADCSGFIWSLYQKCGLSVKEIGLPRTSALMAKSGDRVNLSSIQPGDLVFYGNKQGKVDHVAMYIGNGEVIHESGRKEGCKISKAGYRTILGIRSYLD